MDEDIKRSEAGQEPYIVGSSKADPQPLTKLVPLDQNSKTLGQI